MIRWRPVISWSVLELGIRRDPSNASVNQTIAVCEKARPLETHQKLIYAGKNTLTWPLIRLCILVISRLSGVAIPIYCPTMRANADILIQWNL